MSAGAPRELTCRELVELVTAYLDGALDDGERGAFELHLARCPGCRTYLEQIADTRRAAGRLSERSIPPEAREALLRAFRAWKGRRGAV